MTPRKNVLNEVQLNKLNSKFAAFEVKYITATIQKVKLAKRTFSVISESSTLFLRIIISNTQRCIKKYCKKYLYCPDDIQIYVRNDKPNYKCQSIKK